MRSTVDINGEVVTIWDAEELIEADFKGDPRGPDLESWLRYSVRLVAEDTRISKSGCYSRPCKRLHITC